jgi:Na+/H+-translocating membrane pyrophosphatase
MPSTLIVSLVKAFMACFPFLREFFLGDPKPTSSKVSRQQQSVEMKIKKVLIGIGLGAVLLCIYLSYQLASVATKHHDLLQQIKAAAVAASGVPARVNPPQIPTPVKIPPSPKSNTWGPPPPNTLKTVKKKSADPDDQLRDLRDIQR